MMSCGDWIIVVDYWELRYSNKSFSLMAFCIPNLSSQFNLSTIIDIELGSSPDIVRRIECIVSLARI